jgi:hypothetical protein
MKKIELTQGYSAIVDDVDYERVMAMGSWSVDIHGQKPLHMAYAATYTKNGGEHSWTTTRMHRVIVQAKRGMDVDHINHDGLDNRRANLRVCSHAENIRNKRKSRGTSSIYKGVSWHKSRGKWEAYIIVSGRKTHLGLYADEAEAARAYNEAAREMFGEFAFLNDLSEAFSMEEVG